MRRALLVLLMMSGGCVGTEIGNPPTPTDATVDVDFVALEPEVVAAPNGLTVSEGLEVTRAVLLVGDLRFRDIANCDEADVRFTDGVVSELLADELEVSSLPLPAGDYCGVDVRPRRGGEDGFASEYPELDRLTAFAEGTFEGKPFEIRIENDDELEFVGDFTISNDDHLFIAVDVPAWFDGVDMTAVSEVDGVLLIDDGMPFEEVVEQNIARSISVALDKDGNQTLTPEDFEEGDDD